MLGKHVFFSCVWATLSLIETLTLGRYSTPTTCGLFVISSIYIYAKIFAARLSRPSILAGAQAEDSRSTTENLERKRFAQQMKLAKSCFIVVICCVICYLPITLLGILNKLSGALTDFDFRIYRLWSIWLMLLNSTLNSYIFFWRNGLFRTEAAKVLKGK